MCPMYKLVSCNVYIVLYSLCSGQFIQILNILRTLFQIQVYLYMEWCFSLRVNFFSKLNAHPHDTFVGITKRMNLNVFQYKLLIIPSNQDNHKSLFVITGLQKCVCISSQAYHLRPSLHSSSWARQERVRIKSSCSHC